LRGYKTYRQGQVAGFLPALDRLAVRQVHLLLRASQACCPGAGMPAGLAETGLLGGGQDHIAGRDAAALPDADRCG
jgi:hypothetical protein